MEKHQILTMDSYILLSMLNMKLRDEFLSLHDFCAEYDIEDNIIINRLGNIGYVYNKNSNQFISL